MRLWIDAQLSPAIATWICSSLRIPAVALRDLGLHEATDHQIFLAARQHGVTVVTKDADFVRLLEGLGAPPQVLWITCSDTSNATLKPILKKTFPRSLKLLASGERLAVRMGSKVK